MKFVITTTPQIQKHREYILDQLLYYRGVSTANLKHSENLLLPPTPKYNYREIKWIYNTVFPFLLFLSSVERAKSKIGQ